jgi:hypothetical protein
MVSMSTLHLAADSERAFARNRSGAKSVEEGRFENDFVQLSMQIDATEKSSRELC